jgi:hypothetical protein
MKNKNLLTKLYLLSIKNNMDKILDRCLFYLLILLIILIMYLIICIIIILLYPDFLLTINDYKLLSINNLLPTDLNDDLLDNLNNFNTNDIESNILEDNLSNKFITIYTTILNKTRRKFFWIVSERKKIRYESYQEFKNN